GRVECQTTHAGACGVDQPQRPHLHAAATREPRPAPRPHAAPAQRHRTQQRRLPALRTGLAHRHLHDTRTSQTPTTTPTTAKTNTAAVRARRRHPTILRRVCGVEHARLGVTPQPAPRKTHRWEPRTGTSGLAGPR